MKQLCIFLTIFLLSFTAFSQTKIGDNPLTISPASALEIESTDQGVLLPRLTTLQRDAQGSWTEGHIIYNTTDSCFQFFDGNIWDCMVGASAQPSAPTTSFPFNILATSANCRISDYITEGAPDTLIKEDRVDTPGSPAQRRYWYQFQTLAAAMNNHNIIGFHTDTRVGIDPSFLFAIAQVYYALPDANDFIGKSFLLYTVPDSFYPLTAPNDNGLTTRFIGEIPFASLTTDRPEDWANDHITSVSITSTTIEITTSNRYKIYDPPANVSWEIHATSTGATTLAEYPTLDAPFMIYTSMGPNDWRINCEGVFTYKNPLAP